MPAAVPAARSVATYRPSRIAVEPARSCGRPSRRRAASGRDAVISFAGSHSVTTPRPLHAGQAPCSAFGEKNSIDGQLAGSSPGTPPSVPRSPDRARTAAGSSRRSRSSCRPSIAGCATRSAGGSRPPASGPTRASNSRVAGLLQEPARVGREALGEAVAPLGVERVERQRRLAAARDAGHDGQAVRRESRRRWLQVVGRDAGETDQSRGVAARRLSAVTSRSRLRGARRPPRSAAPVSDAAHARDLLRRARWPRACPPMRPLPGPEIDHAVGGADDIELVLDGDDRVALSDQPVERGEQHARHRRGAGRSSARRARRACARGPAGSARPPA